MSAPSSHVVFSHTTLGGLLEHSAIVCPSVSTPLSLCQHEWGSTMVFSLMLGFYFPKVSVLMGCPFFISWLERAGFIVVFFFFFFFPCSHWPSHIIGFFSSKSGYMRLKESLENSPPCFFFHLPKSLVCLPSSLHLSVASYVLYIYVWCFKVFFYMTNRETMFTLCSHEQNSYTFNFKMRKLKSWIRTHSQQWHDWIRFLLTQLFVQCSHHCNSEM